MAKLFNNIRKKLVSDKPSTTRTANYLKYAIGEIVLVVIGILIALSINNWDSNKNQQKKELLLIASLKKEIKNNIVFLKNTVKFNDSIYNNSKIFFETAIKDQTSIEISNIPGLFDYAPDILNTPILDNILESNSRLLITNNTYLKKLRELKNKYSNIEKIVYYGDEFWNSKVTEFLINSGLGIYFDDNLKITNNLKSSFKIDIHFLSLLIMSKTFQKKLIQGQNEGLIKSKETLIFLEKN